MNVGEELLQVAGVIDSAAPSLAAVFASRDKGLDANAIEEVIRAELWFACEDLSSLFAPEAQANRDALAEHIDDALEAALRHYLTGEL